MMHLGEAVIRPSRYNFNKFAMFAKWKDEESLDNFLQIPTYENFSQNGWHVRLKLYRTWGGIKELKDSYIYKKNVSKNNRVVAVTLARLKINQALRFIKWGKPVEQQVRDHKGKNLALAAMRPMHTLSTFSIWDDEDQMIGMVKGVKDNYDGNQHRNAMQERNRKSFHHEFMTMRFIPIKEMGSWNRRSKYIFS